MPTLSELFVYPVKSLDALAVEHAAVGAGGALALDRRYALCYADDRSRDGLARFVNGKNERRVHRLQSTFDPETDELTISGGDERRTFHVADDRRALDEWLTALFGFPVELRGDDALGYPDDTDASGPTVISTGTLDELASWFDDITPVEMRRRLRPNLVVDAPAFWEDRLYADPGSTVPFAVGDVTFEGVQPCQRCVVPSRDPDTGAETPGFRKRFVERREATLPAWANDAQFDHYYRVMVNTRVRECGSIRVGDRVSIE